MTFLEAAIEVLKREGKPLELRQLAELAVRHNLLSVVGRDPVGTMQERLDDALEKPDAKMPLFEVKKGTYGLRSYPPRPYPLVEEKKTNGHPRSEAVAVSDDQVEGDEPAEGEAAAAPAVAGEAGAAGEKKKRRRGRRGGRGRRGRREGGEAAAAGAPGEAEETDEAADEGESVEAAGEAAGEGETAAPSEVAAAGEAGGDEKRARRRSRRGGRGRRTSDKQEAAAVSSEPASEPTDETPTGEHQVVRVNVAPGGEGDDAAELLGEGGAISAEEAVVIAESDGGEPTGGGQDELLVEEAELLEESVGEDEDFDLPGGPLLAPSLGAEEVTRSEDERVVREEILGRRSDERGRRRGHDRGRGRGRDREPRREGGQAQRAEGAKAHEGHRPAHHEDKRPEHRQPERHPERHEEKREHAPRGDKGNLIDVILEVLRTSEGRPMHVRAMADVALKRNLAAGLGGHGDVVRQFRAALVREQRDREADGLRARVRALGGGHFAPADRKLDPELVPLEREVAQASLKLREATRSAVRRRIQRLPPPAFEALGRALLDKLGVTGVELVRRGDGVAYYGGQRQAGVATVKTLVAMRPGENELGRRAVGELRAGLAAKGFDEGILLSGGRLNAEALAELKNGGGVSAHDAESMSALCLRHGLGVRRVQMPIDYLDLELFSELTEA